MQREEEWVWVDSDTGVPIGARVKVTLYGERLLENDEGKEQSLSQEQEASLRIMHPTSVKGVDNMIKLGELTEADLLRNLQLRHKHRTIYTYIGSVLVAVNPYQDFPIYSGDQVRLYHGRKLGELPPHIFAIAESCYSHMTRHLRNQCCIISGESGAGKTESTKLILQYLVAVSGELSQQQIEQQIVESNPILEAFGNAKTIHNDNSSRFGKYLEIIFDKNGVIEGARMEQYLLEKSRVCHQALEERNYHIFYCMLAGASAEERETLSLGHAKEYTFLTKGGSIVCEGRDDAEDYKCIRSAMKILTFSENKCQEILKLLAAILHLGNVSFKANTENNLETSDVSKSQHFSIAASLLGVQQSSLAATLTHRSVMTNRESVTKPLNSEQAADCRDAFVKAIYNKLFIWIVEKINSVTFKRLTESCKSVFVSIGLLDIFGFENFDTNSFEQLCINFASERLQQYFVNHFFKLEQEEYLKEGIVWKNIEFTDNQNILDLLAGQPCNLLSLIDEESYFPRGSDITMLQKMNQELSGNKTYIARKTEHDTDFGIHHFAGVVYYDSNGFLEKNRDAISLDIIKMVDVSTTELLRQIFENDLSTNGLKTSNKNVIVTPKNSLRSQTGLRIQVPTLSAQFRQSLDSLMRALSACHPFFIRCIKPNNDKLPEVFDRQLCMRQLRYFGVMDTIRIRKLGYPIRHTFADFLKRYRVFLKTTACNPNTKTAAACCEAICKTVFKQKDEWKIGRTKIFLRDTHDTFLERLREQELNRKALVIQCAMMGYKERQSFLRKRRAAVVLQRHWRAYKEAILPLRKLLHGFERLVSKIRSQKLHSQYRRQRAAALTIQSQLRGYWVRKDWQRKRKAAILLQTNIRGLLARKEAEMLRNYKRSIVLEEDEYDDSSDEFSFYKFSILHFQNNATHTHVSQRLTKPLLLHDDKDDALACLTVSWIILRFMEDIPEPESLDTMHQVSGAFSRHLPRRQAKRLHSLGGQDKKSKKKSKKRFGGGKRKDVIVPEEQENTLEDEGILIEEGPTLDRPLSSLEKLHIIIGYALSRREIRDEIYCQICKQLVDNNNKGSVMQGWTLLSICLGIFPPTDLFMKYLENFVREGPSGYREYCTKRLRRVKANGERQELPCLMEIQAAESVKPIDVSVTLMDSRTFGLHLDPASISAEVCQALADKIDLRDTFGFSLYINVKGKMWSLGSGGKHVFDAVSQYEQEIKRQGEDEKDAPWRLYFRKELFTPWHDCSVDPVSTDLIYRQVITGLKWGEYSSDKEDEYVDLAAKHYYIQFGSENDKDNVQTVVEECIPTPLIESISMTRWIQLISSAHLQDPYVSENQRAEKVKGELVDRARHIWALYFSEFYYVMMMSEPPLPNSSFVLAINWYGIFLMDERDRILLELPYLEIKKVGMVRESDFSPQSVSLDTVRGEFVLRCDEAADMAALIEEHLEGLRQRSVYALSQQDVSKTDDPMFLVCKRGDLLLVEGNQEYFSDNEWIRATNQQTSSSVVVLRDTVQFLPTLSRPSDEVLELLSQGAVVQNAQQRDETVGPATLKEFALENFRPAGRDGRGQHASKEVREEKLWTHSTEPLKQPLMRSLVHNADLSSLACSAFIAILKYMGDYPIKNARRPVELTDQIFGQATQLEALQDEIYCQIMKQMTINNNRSSMERGWQLMWLCSGLFLPSHNLMGHARRFLETRLSDQLAAGCLQRLHEMRSKEHRKFPPHLVEVDAIQQNSDQIFHKVHFPNDTDDIYKVTSTTTVKDLCSSIASELKLSSADEYGLYLKVSNKVMILDEQKYFFDSLRQTSDVPKKSKRVKEGNQLYLVIFKRKLWFNVSPGNDLVADFTFHFPQEMSTYLQGYHNCSKEDMINLGGLLFRVTVGSDTSQFVMIPKMLKNLVPADKIKSMSSEEWKKHIISSYNKQSGISAQEAKIAFLRAISSWPTFGYAFFEVRQTSEVSYPYTVLIAIGQEVVSFINPKTKELLVMHPFSSITDYHSRGDHFQMTTSTHLKDSNFACETSHASTMEDLLRSYISMYKRQRQASQPFDTLSRGF